MHDRKTLWIVNGPNLNLLEKRPAQLYGGQSFDSYLKKLRATFPTLNIPYFQSNSEGALIDHLQKIGFECNGIVLNAAALTHTSIALADTIELIPAPVVEVHITDPSKREPFRKNSFIRPHCIAHITGKGLKGYEMAIQVLLKYHSE